MKNRTLFALWGFLFIVCAGLGFIPEPEGAVQFLLTGASLLFFVPPALLLWQSAKAGDRRTIGLIFGLSAASLLATLLALILNFLGAVRSEALGNALHAFLTIVSAPMMASGYWVLSLFLWACLLMVSISQLRKTK